MPPKGKGKKDAPAKLADKENLARAETEVLSLQRILELRSHEALEARRSERLWRERVDAFTSALEQQKEDTLDITSDMLRQYKTMQEQMTRRIAELEGENRSLRRVVEDKDVEVARLQAEKDAMRKACDAEVLDYQRRMEDMQLEFTQMLRDTLDKMHERLAAGIQL
mmetsp:Transcript_7485/g.16232  ORF Transcript_7485/g.16232 Transcript_7485/m.16232 type:complete len:167 (+) Transcript_7485:253-753(+)|eukprot:CAMPEP_0202905088 /NCGR_PEP_ID=MMETSP1392-20130828/32451_1 /ASSEMBLY_ACC=CAM_ASM_000868 /TAXON_ID=225041 /ORGANISM="Chlamydomonas chlamydogama, Strain SAG 11-48b" /LENGTH=166 /DNA_ID=CAMNT_0049593023 /DNA_START=178 /DNA_END=678 /DNA_ORIENTATION=+